MAKSANHLRLYIEPPPAPDAVEALPCEALKPVCAAFERLTGWSLRYRPGRAPSQDLDLLWSAPVDPGVGASPGHLRIELGRAPGDDERNRLDLDAAGELAAGVCKLVGEQWRLRQALAAREAELAVCVPVAKRHDDAQHLALRLEAALRGGAQALGCQAAALYLLDDATTQLKLRSAWGLPIDRFTRPPRPLEGATADLEALAGHAIVMADPSVCADWPRPEKFPAAVCVPVASSTMPLGTLWMFGARSRDFRDEEVNIVEIVAGRIATDLEREVLLAEGVAGARLQGQLADAERIWQTASPTRMPALAGWDTGAALTSPEPLAGLWCDWTHSADGTAALFVGASERPGLAGAALAAIVRSAFRAAATASSAGDLLSIVNRAVWTTTGGGLAAEALLAQPSPDGSRVAWRAAGEACVYIATDGRARSARVADRLLNLEPDAAFAEQATELAAGDALIVIVGGGDAAQQSAALDRLVQQTLDMVGCSATAAELAAALGQALALRGDLSPDTPPRRAALVLRRTS